MVPTKVGVTIRRWIRQSILAVVLRGLPFAVTPETAPARMVDETCRAAGMLLSVPSSLKRKVFFPAKPPPLAKEMGVIFHNLLILQYFIYALKYNHCANFIKNIIFY